MPSLVRDHRTEHQRLKEFRAHREQYDHDCPFTYCRARYVGPRAKGEAWLEEHLRSWHKLPVDEVLRRRAGAE